MWPRVWPGVGTATMRPSAVRALEAGKAPRAGPSRVIGCGSKLGGSGWRVTARWSAAHGGIGDGDLVLAGEDGDTGDVREAVDVVAMDVGQDDGRDVGGREARGLELTVELVVAGDVELREGRAAGGVRLAGVDEEQAFRMLD